MKEKKRRDFGTALVIALILAILLGPGLVYRAACYCWKANSADASVQGGE